MKKSDLRIFLNNIADDGDVNEAILGHEEFKNLKDLSKLSTENISEILGSETGKAYITSHDDSVRSKAVESYKNGKGKEAIEKARLEGIEEGKNGKKKSPEMERIEALEKKNAELEAQALKNTTNAAIGKILEGKKLPSELIDFVYGDGQEETYTKNIDTLEKIINGAVDNGVKSKLGTSSYTPPTGGQADALNAQIAGAMGVQ